MPRPTIGFWTAVTLVLGNVIGSGVFLLPASLAPYGGLALAGWLLSAAGSMLLALVFARLARLNPAAGGIYAYTREAFGDLAGFLVAWGYWISIWCAEAALARGTGQSCAHLRWSAPERRAGGCPTGHL